MAALRLTELAHGGGCGCKLAPAVLQQLLAGSPVAGGHSIATAEPIYGVAVIGSCRPEQLRRNSGARPGDALILTKAIGVGIYANALRKGALDREGYAEMLASTTQLNSVGA